MSRRRHNFHFLASDSEAERIRQKMQDVGIEGQAAYLRKMALDGYCVKLELDELKEMVRLLRICSNNLNQYTKKANETGNVYAEDISDLRERLDGIWGVGKEIIRRLSAIR